MAIDVKVTLPKVLLPKTAGHATSIFQSYRLENKLLQQLGEEMDAIISNIVQSKICHFIKFNWNLLPPNLLLFIIYIDIKQVVTCYHLKINLAA